MVIIIVQVIIKKNCIEMQKIEWKCHSFNFWDKKKKWLNGQKCGSRDMNLIFNKSNPKSKHSSVAESGAKWVFRLQQRNYWSITCLKCFNYSTFFFLSIFSTQVIEACRSFFPHRIFFPSMLSYSDKFLVRKSTNKRGWAKCK